MQKSQPLNIRQDDRYLHPIIASCFLELQTSRPLASRRIIPHPSIFYRRIPIRPLDKPPFDNED